MNLKGIDPQTKDVLQLLLFVITADSRILDEEVASFRDVSIGMKLTNSVGDPLSATWLSEWFTQNCESARAQSGQPETDSTLVHLFVRLKDWPNKIQLLDALCSVAASDGQIHLNEKVLITLAAAYWDTKSPDVK